MAATRRLFAGIALGDAARAAGAAAAERLRQTGFSARYEDPGNLHVTLAFLGNVEAANVEAAVAAMQEAAAASTVSVREAFGRLGYVFRDDAVAHVTLARVKRPDRPLPLVEIVPFAAGVRALTLFESLHDKTKNASRYDAFHRIQLSGAAANGGG